MGLETKMRIWIHCLHDITSGLWCRRQPQIRTVAASTTLLKKHWRNADSVSPSALGPGARLISLPQEIHSVLWNSHRLGTWQMIWTYPSRVVITWNISSLSIISLVIDKQNKMLTKEHRRPRMGSWRQALVRSCLGGLGYNFSTYLITEKKTSNKGEISGSHGGYTKMTVFWIVAPSSLV